MRIQVWGVAAGTEGIVLSARLVLSYAMAYTSLPTSEVLKMAATATVRVTAETRERLKRLGDERKLSTPELLDALTQRAEEDQLLADHESAMRQIMADPERAQSYRAELSAWDDALLDGLAKL